MAREMVASGIENIYGNRREKLKVITLFPSRFANIIPDPQEGGFVGRLQHVDLSPYCYPSYPPQAERDFPQYTEGHPTDRDSNSSGHTKYHA